MGLVPPTRYEDQNYAHCDNYSETILARPIYLYQNAELQWQLTRLEELSNGLDNWLESRFRFIPIMLRHACGFYLASRGHDTRAIQAYLGHKNIQHTVRYTELAPDGLRISGWIEKLIFSITFAVTSL
jgi:integrase